MLDGPRPDTVTLGVVVSLSGVMGVAGPGILNAARLAAEEGATTMDRPLRLVVIDAGQGPWQTARDVAAVIGSTGLDGIVGAHTSDVRVAIERTVAGRVPYVFTPPHESVQPTGSTVFIGDGPVAQLREPVRALMHDGRVRRWALIGNDYVWPRSMHAAARAVIADLGGQVVYDRLVPVGVADADELVDQVMRSAPHAVLVSLIGRDGIVFHRAFGASAAARSCLRLCTALDENCLLAAGGDDTGTLFSAMPFFDVDGNGFGSIHAAYTHRYGAPAPTPGAYAVGCYDGVRLLADVVGRRADIAHTGASAYARLRTRSPVGLARAAGTWLEPVAAGGRP